MSTTPLSDSREIVERSLFHSIRKEVVDKGYLPDVNQEFSGAIVAINQGAKTFSISGNLTTNYINGRKLVIKNSTANNGEYNILSSTLSGGNTIISVLQVIPDNTLDGSANIYRFYDDPSGVALFQNSLMTIANNLGFAIEVFGSSNSQAKYIKKIPRIVILTNQSLPGTLGGAPDRFYLPNNGDILNPNFFSAQVQPPQTVDITFDIHLVSNSSKQSRILHGILALSVPKRGYVPFYNDETKRIFVNQYSYRNINNTVEGIMEDIYMYKANDIFETNDVIVGTNIKPITEIKVDMDGGEPGNNKPLDSFTVD